MSDFVNGALIDTRPPEQKAKDWTQKEVIASAAPVIWTEKQQSDWRKFPIFNQDGSGSCVAQTEAKELGIMRSLIDGVYVHFSAADIYQRRANKPGTGMAAADARAIIANGGATLEVLAPSQNMTDSAMDAVVVEQYKRDVGNIFKVPNYLEITDLSIDAVASTIQATKKGVMVWFYFKIDEWTDKPIVKYPSLTLMDAESLKHSVTAVDFTLVNGEKALIIEDSWGTSFGVAGQRIITESFFKTRNWYRSYLINFKFQSTGTKPQHVFLTDLSFGMTSSEVVALQDCLKWAGFFPSNADSTGYFGAITKKAVGDYQIARGIVSSSVSPGYGNCGPVTRGKLNIEFQ